MPVPPEIRAVERPKNTIVEDRGRDGPKRYAVRERGSIKCIPGRNPQPLIVVHRICCHTVQLLWLNLFQVICLLIC